ncbi:hypothetical protein [Piscinibacter koreensis]|uniref:hypothetical protein n=1 Tax=Piscinibacter koreensis TaxID=2742824 RepID=UPI001FEBA483|nr:hypothetical protein [Schlegelella koreensis]
MTLGDGGTTGAAPAAAAGAAGTTDKGADGALAGAGAGAALVPPTGGADACNAVVGASERTAGCTSGVGALPESGAASGGGTTARSELDAAGVFAAAHPASATMRPISASQRVRERGARPPAHARVLRGRRQAGRYRAHGCMKGGRLAARDVGPRGGW